jgi:hypothetical protein
VYRQHQHVRGLVERAARRPWPEYSAQAVAEWLQHDDAAMGEVKFG